MGVLPRSVRRRIAAHRHPAPAQSACSVQILSPHPGQRVPETGIIEGRATVSSGSYLWVLMHRKDVDGWWPQGDGAVAVAGDSWTAQVKYGGPGDAGFQFEVAAVLVAQTVHERWLEWVQTLKATGEFPPVRLPMPPAVLAEAYRTIQRESPAERYGIVNPHRNDDCLPYCWYPVTGDNGNCS
jgi:hypothetical protein